MTSNPKEVKRYGSASAVAGQGLTWWYVLSECTAFDLFWPFASQIASRYLSKVVAVHHCLVKVSSGNSILP